jgi:uncharacterized membrane protein YedE/YeeE
MQNVTQGMTGGITKQMAQAGFAGLMLAGVLALAIYTGEHSFPIFWLVGLAFGITVQRSRFCFAAAFRDFFLVGQTRMIKGVLVGLGVSTLGFTMVMSTIVPNPGFGLPPADANILPVGLSTLIAGTVFGVGMVLAGGCVSGSLSRMGEGYIASWVTIAGVVTGLVFLNRTWNWWWDNLISYEPIIWMPAEISYTWAMVVTFACLALVLYSAVLWERRKASGFTIIEVKKKPETPPFNAKGEIFGYLRLVFRKEWSPIVGGLVLGLLNLLLFIRFHPLGVVGEISRWSTSLTTMMGLPSLELRGMESLGACALVVADGSWLTEGLFLNVGIIAGAAASSMFSGEFKIRVPRSPIRYGQSLIGGIAMGYGAGLGLGCTLGAFFSAVPSLALSGWVYAIGLTLGAFFGTKIIRRFA